MKTKVKYLIGFFLGIWCLSISAQDSIKSNPQITINELQRHVNYLASDDLEGRGLGSAGIDSATKYLVSQFKGSGLNSFYDESTSKFLQPIQITKTNISENTSLNFYYKDTSIFTLGSEYILSHFGFIGNESLIGEIKFVETGIFEPEYNYQDYKTEDIYNKWIVITEDVPLKMKDILPEKLYNLYADIRTGSTLRAKKAKENGAIGVLIIPSKQGFDLWERRAIAFNEFYHLDKYGSLYRYSPIPMLFIDSTLINVLKKAKLDDSVQGKLHLNKELNIEKISSANIIGFVRGTDSILSNEYIVVGAHFDHLGTIDNLIYNGADDNASGTSALLEVAEAVSYNPFKRSVIFTLFSGEESGWLGSISFVENPPIPLDNIKVMVNIDMVGRLDGQANQIAPISPYLPYEYWKSKITKIQIDTSKIVIDLNYAETFPWKFAGDHFPFHLKNIPSIMLANGLHNDYHQTTDNIEKIDFDFLEQNAKFTYSIIKMLANE